MIHETCDRLEAVRGCPRAHEFPPDPSSKSPVRHVLSLQVVLDSWSKKSEYA